METGIIEDVVVILGGNTTTQCRELIEKLVTYASDKPMHLWPIAIENLEPVVRSIYIDPPPHDTRYTTIITSNDGSGKEYKEKVVTNECIARISIEQRMEYQEQDLGRDVRKLHSQWNGPIQHCQESNLSKND